MFQVICGSFLPRRAAYAALVIALFPALATAEAGRVTFAHGAVAAIAADGTRRVLNRNSDIDAGDTINTGRGRAQLRFTDGSFVSLKPNTEFRVDEYAYKSGEETQQRGFFSLLRGGLRTITGLIGRARKANYRMKTSVATIGIRGTEYGLDLRTNDDGEQLLTWNVANDGKSSISLVLASGEERVFTWGGSGSATSETFAQLEQALQTLAQQGKLQGVTRDEVAQIFASGDVVDAQGLQMLLAAVAEPPPEPPPEPPQPPALQQAPPPSCGSTAAPGCALAAAYGATSATDDDGNIVAGVQGAIVSAQFDAGSGGLRSYIIDDGEGGSIGDAGSAQVVVDGSAYFSVDPAEPMDPQAIATWGRWIAPAGGDGASSGNFPHPLGFRSNNPDTFAYVISIPPALTFNTGSAQYNLVGFTPPVASGPGPGAGSLGAAGAVTGTLGADFGNSRVSVDMNVQFANGTYNVSSSALGMFSRGGTASAGAPFFGGPVIVTGTGVACGTACSGDATGNVFGPRADGAALGYGLRDPNLTSDITGAAVFQQQSCTDCGTMSAGQ